MNGTEALGELLADVADDPMATVPPRRLRRSRKRPDWRDRLERTIADATEAPFVWGTNDCALFAARCVEAMTGHDLGAPLRGTYESPAGALRALRRYGYDGVGPFAHALLGPARAVPEDAETGDVVLVELEAGPALAIAFGAQAITAREPSGLGTVPPTRWLASWEI